jgi:hypothetical protein
LVLVNKWQKSSDRQPTLHAIRVATYVYDTEDDRHLHLERVGKDEGIIGSVPVWVDTERINLSIGDTRNRTFPIFRPIETVGPDVQRLGKDIVVNETSEYRESTHQ